MLNSSETVPIDMLTLRCNGLARGRSRRASVGLLTSKYTNTDDDDEGDVGNTREHRLGLTLMVHESNLY